MDAAEAVRAAKAAAVAIAHPEYGIDGAAQVAKLLDFDRQLYAVISERAQSYGIAVTPLPTADQASELSSPAAAASQYIGIIESIERSEDKIGESEPFRSLPTTEQIIESTVNSLRILPEAHEAAFELLRFWRKGQPTTKTEQGLDTFPGPAEMVLDIVKEIRAEVKLMNDRLQSHGLV